MPRSILTQPILLLHFQNRSGDASNDDHGAVTGIASTRRASLDQAPAGAAADDDDGVIDVFAQDEFRDVQVIDAKDHHKCDIIPFLSFIDQRAVGAGK